MEGRRPYGRTRQGLNSEGSAQKPCVRPELERGKGARDVKSNRPLMDDSAAMTLLIGLGTTIGGQTPQQPNQDTPGALLVEVRDLRSAIEQMASVVRAFSSLMGRRSPASRRAGRKSISDWKRSRALAPLTTTPAEIPSASTESVFAVQISPGARNRDGEE